MHDCVAEGLRFFHGRQRPPGDERIAETRVRLNFLKRQMVDRCLRSLFLLEVQRAIELAVDRCGYKGTWVW
jgi:hypothetical protein